MTIGIWLAIANFIVVIAGFVGGVLALRSAKGQTESTIQERVREALTTENELLQNQINRLKQDNRRLTRIIQLIVSTLKKSHGIDLEIDEDALTLRDQGGQRSLRVETPDTA